MAPKNKKLVDDLPENVLCSIISRLPFKQAVVTSAVSRSWRNLWRWISNFELLDPTYRSYHRRRKFESHLDRIVNSSVLLNSFIRSCKIINFPGMENFIQFLVDQKGLQDLCLVGNLELLPDRILFESQKAKLFKLRLVNFEVSGYSFFSGYANLLVLELEGVTVEGKCKTVDEILSFCSRLERLFLNTTTEFDKLTIYHDTLKFLEIQSVKFSELRIEGEALRSIRLRGVKCKDKLYIKCPYLEELSMVDHNGLQSKDVLERCSGIMRGTGIEYHTSPTYMEKLKDLSVVLDLNNNRHNIVLAYGLKVWSCLEKLCITNQVDRQSAPHTLPYFEHSFWERRDIPDCFAFNLTKVQIRGFSGTEHEIRFASHLIKNATQLKQLLIEYDPRTVSDLHSLLALPKASPDACIIFKGRVCYYY